MSLFYFHFLDALAEIRELLIFLGELKAPQSPSEISYPLARVVQISVLHSAAAFNREKLLMAYLLKLTLVWKDRHQFCGQFAETQAL